jgi:hypothetical protein
MADSTPGADRTTGLTGDAWGLLLPAAQIRLNLAM